MLLASWVGCTVIEWRVGTVESTVDWRVASRRHSLPCSWAHLRPRIRRPPRAVWGTQVSTPVGSMSANKAESLGMKSQKFENFCKSQIQVKK